MTRQEGLIVKLTTAAAAAILLTTKMQRVIKF